MGEPALQVKLEQENQEYFVRIYTQIDGISSIEIKNSDRHMYIEIKSNIKISRNIADAICIS